MKTNNKGSNSQKWKPRIRFIAGIKSCEIVQFEVSLYVGHQQRNPHQFDTGSGADTKNGQIGKKNRRKRTNGSNSFGMLMISFSELTFESLIQSQSIDVYDTI